MRLELTITDLPDGTPFAGVAVYVWHCTRDGGYSLYSEGVEDQNYLRGVQIADATGRVAFTSMFPASYSGRWPTSTSRSTRTRRRSPTRPTPSPRRRLPCQRTCASWSTPGPGTRRRWRTWRT